MKEKPKNINSAAEMELMKAEAQFDEFKNQVEEMTLDNMNKAPLLEVEPQTKISQKDISNSTDVYLKPFRTIQGSGKFNERFREEWDFRKEYVYFIAENLEIIGEEIEMWTRPYPGVNCEFWKIPTNKPIWAPRHVAERLTQCNYHVLEMKETATGTDVFGTTYGKMVVSNTKNRLNAIPATKRRSIFMGETSFK